MNIVIAHGRDVSRADGGSSRVVAICSYLSSLGHNVFLVVPDPRQEFPDKLNSVSIRTVSKSRRNIHSLSGKMSQSSSVIRTAQKLVEKKSAVLQIENSTLAGVGVLLGCKSYVVDVHDIAYSQPLPIFESRLGTILRWGVKYIEALGIARSSSVITASESIMEFVNKIPTVTDQKKIIAPNGFHQENITQYQTSTTTQGRVVFLGSLRPLLDIEPIMEVANLESVKEMVVVGDGKKQEELEKRAEYNDSLSVTGYLPDDEAFNLLDSAEVVINPQLSSDAQKATSPVKLAHYAALGKPMVITRGPKMANYLSKSGAAELSDPEKPVEFASKVDEILLDKRRQEQMSKAATSTSEQLVWDVRLNSIQGIY